MNRNITRSAIGAWSRALLVVSGGLFAITACGDDDDPTGDPQGGNGGVGNAGAGGSDGGAPEDGGEGGAPTATTCRGIAIPSDSHFVADGLCARAVAVNQGRLRQIAFTPGGDLIGVRVSGEILRYRDLNQDGVFEGDDEIVEIANIDGDNGNNAHVDEEGGYLYAGSLEGVKRWVYSPDADDLGEAEVVVTGQPSTGTHRYHTVHVYDGYLYVHSGSENNAVAPASPEYDTDRSVLKRFELSAFESDTPFEWDEGEVFAVGLRNMVGFTRDAEGRIFGVVNGMDNLLYAGADVHDENPGDDLRLIEQGSAHGYPYCFTASRLLIEDEPIAPGTQLASETDPSAPDPDFTNPHDDAWCAANSTPPATFLPPHSAPLDLTFFDDEPEGRLPEQYRGGAFVALHGSWNSEPSVGHQVVFVPFDDGEPELPSAGPDGTVYPYSVVFGGGNASGSVDGAWGWSAGEAGEDPVRPVGVAVSPVDGALYVSSDNGQVSGSDTEAAEDGVLYRIELSE